MNSKKQDLARLAVGDRVKVRLNDGTKVTGVLRSVTDYEPAMLHITLPRGRLVVRGLGNIHGPGVKSVKVVRPAPAPDAKPDASIFRDGMPMILEYLDPEVSLKSGSLPDAEKSVRPAPSSKTPQALPVEGRPAWDVLRSCGVAFTGSRDAESCAHRRAEGGRIVVREGDEVIASAGTYRCVDCGMIRTSPMIVPATDEPATGPKLIRTVIKL